MTLIDKRQYKTPATPNCDVVWSIDAVPAFDVLIEAVRHFA
jgi:hypothetical protein